MFSRQHEREKAALTDTEKKAATNFFQSYFHYLGTGEGHQEVLRDINEIKAGNYAGLETLAPKLCREFARILRGILPTDEHRPYG